MPWRVGGAGGTRTPAHNNRHPSGRGGGAGEAKTPRGAQGRAGALREGGGRDPQPLAPCWGCMPITISEESGQSSSQRLYLRAQVPGVMFSALACLGDDLQGIRGGETEQKPTCSRAGAKGGHW